MGLEEVGHEPQHLVQAQVTLAVVEAIALQQYAFHHYSMTQATQHASDDRSSTARQTDRQTDIQTDRGKRALKTPWREGGSAHYKVHLYG